MKNTGVEAEMKENDRAKIAKYNLCAGKGLVGPVVVLARVGSGLSLLFSSSASAAVFGGGPVGRGNISSFLEPSPSKSNCAAAILGISAIFENF